MSEKREDGGPAFPTPDIPEWDSNGNRIHIHEGMTLRDYFAAHVTDEDVAWATRWYTQDFKVGACSRMAARYYFADLMIAERNKP